MPYSPMMKQYLETKEKYKDCILLYRLGDFYEMFFEDAEECSRILELTLTGKDCGMEARAPMCGVPYHAVSSYISKLVSAGKKVAICEQMTDPSESKGIVLRDVVRIVTPGTIMDTDAVDETHNNYIASVSVDKKKIGLAYCDILTGEFFAVEFSGSDAFTKTEDQLVKIAPKELITNSVFYEMRDDIPIIKVGIIPKPQPYYDWTYSYETAVNTLKQHFNVSSLTVFSCENKKLAISASGALIEYLKETQKRALIHINSLKYIKSEDFMQINVNSRRNLELTKNNHDGKKKGSLLGILDRTKTAMGSRLMSAFFDNPLIDIDKINMRLDGVGDFVENIILRESVSEILSQIRDIERLTSKLSCKLATPVDIISLADSLSKIPDLVETLDSVKSDILKQTIDEIDDLSSVCNFVFSAIINDPPQLTRDGGFIKSGFSAELDDYRAISADGSNEIAEFEQNERKRTGIKNIRVGNNRVFGYYIEVPKAFSDTVPKEYVRRQTVSNCERYVTEELTKLQNKIFASKDLAVKLEQSLFDKIVLKLSEFVPSFQKTARAVALIDVLYSFADVSAKNSYVRPSVVEAGGALLIKGGRHPVVEQALEENTFVENDTFINNEDRTMIITGPNMAGKSTYMRQVALIVFMTHIGCYVPARSAQVPIVDKIFTRIGASDNLLFNQSTFMLEMTEMATILHQSTENSLLLLDEIGRGTSTHDGLSIAWAIIEYITKNIRSRTLFSTHYHELTELEGLLDGAKNFNVTVKEQKDGIVFLRKIVRGGTDKSFGIEVAKLAGIKGAVITRAKVILQRLESADINNSQSSSAQFAFNLSGLTGDEKLDKIKKLYLISEELNKLDNTELIGFLNRIKSIIDE